MAILYTACCVASGTIHIHYYLRTKTMSSNIGQTILDWIQQHKLATGILGTVFAVILFFALISTLLSGSLGSQSSSSFDAAPSAARDMSYRQASVETASDGAVNESPDASGVLIREGNVLIDSEDTVQDEIEIRTLTESFNGYIQEASQSNSNTRHRTNMTARVPADSFADYVDSIRDRFEIENYQIRDFRIEIQEQTTELDIIADTMDRYAEMKAELQRMAVGAERINLTMDITDKQLDLKRQENRLTQQVDRVNRRGDMATLNITLDQRVSAEIWPEDIGNEIRDKIRSVINDVVGITIAIFTTSLVVFMTTIQWAIYLLIILGVLWFAWRLLRKLYRRFKE